MFQMNEKKYPKVLKPIVIRESSKLKKIEFGVKLFSPLRFFWAIPRLYTLDRLGWAFFWRFEGGAGGGSKFFGVLIFFNWKSN